MEFIVIILLFIIISILIYFKLFIIPSKNNSAVNIEKENKDGKPLKFCPLCNSSLAKNENVKSKLYPSESRDKIMDVFGCKNCIPPNGTVARICPVCKKKIPADGFVTGRYFIKPGKNHLHILGCTLCRKIK
jgi:hypothetical protein